MYVYTYIYKVIGEASTILWDLICLFVAGLVVLSICCMSLFTDGMLHGRCVVSQSNKMAQTWTDTQGIPKIDAFHRHSVVGELKVPEQFCSELTGVEACGEGFECSCKPPVLDRLTLQYDVKDRSYLVGRPGCRKIPFGRMGDKNEGEPTTMLYGFLGFDNFAQTIFTVFHVSTLSNWGSIMNSVLQAYGTEGCFVFLAVVVTMRYWVLNLAVGIIPAVYLSIRRTRDIVKWDSAMERAELALLQQLKAQKNHGPGNHAQLTGCLIITLYLVISQHIIMFRKTIVPHSNRSYPRPRHPARTTHTHTHTDDADQSDSDLDQGRDDPRQQARLALAKKLGDLNEVSPKELSGIFSISDILEKRFNISLS